MPPGIATVSTGPKAWMLRKFCPEVAADVDSATCCSTALVYCRWTTLTMEDVPGAGTTNALEAGTITDVVAIPTPGRAAHPAAAIAVTAPRSAALARNGPPRREKRIFAESSMEKS